MVEDARKNHTPIKRYENILIGVKKSKANLSYPKIPNPFQIMLLMGCVTNPQT